MWTCGIAIATQHEMLAIESSTVSVLAERLRLTCGGGALAWSRAPPVPMMERNTSSSTLMVTAQKMPIAIWVVRQP